MATRVFDRNELILATLRKVDFFSKWPTDVISTMARSSQLWRFSKGEIVYEAGTPPSGVHILVDGSVLNGRTWSNGKSMATSIVRPGWPCGVRAAWDGGEYAYSGTARSDLLAVLIPSANFRAAVRGDQKRVEALVTFSCIQIGQDSEALQRRAIGSYRSMMAGFLAFLAKPVHHIPEDPSSVDPTAFDVTQDELAAMLFCSRQNVNQIMKAMEREGVLRREGNRLRILSFLKLLAILEEEEPIHPLWREEIIALEAKLRAMDVKGDTAPRPNPRQLPA